MNLWIKQFISSDRKHLATANGSRERLKNLDSTKDTVKSLDNLGHLINAVTIEP
jgi:hypothetical protein